MPTIKITREKEFMNLWRNYRIYIDDVEVGAIANGETKEFEVDPGVHRVKSKIDWCGSQELSFEIKDDEAKHFEVAGFRNSKWLMPTLLGLLGFDFILQLLFGFDLAFYLLLPGFFLLMYYITIKRNRYLRLTPKS